MQDALRFWLERGADGYRVDAIDRLLKDPQLRDDPPAIGAVRAAAARGRGQAGADQLAQRARHRRGARQDPRGVRRRLPGRRGVPAERALAALHRATSTRCSRSSCCTRRGTRACCARRSRPATRRAGRRPGCSPTTTSGGSPTRFGAENARAAAMLLLTLPGPGVPLPGRRDRPGARARAGVALRPRRARPPSPPDAVGRLAERRLHHRRAVAAARRPGAAQRRRPARRPALDARRSCAS